MTESYKIAQYNIFTSTLPYSNKITYLIVPEGLESDIVKWSAEAAGRHNTNIVILSGLNWNDDLTPWPAEGVFKKAKPFGGKASIFLETLTEKLIPEIENRIKLNNPERTLGGISLSGLFAIWTMFKSNGFKNVISISGSLWYDDFVHWTNTEKPNEEYERVFITLGDREKNSKNVRMAIVEDATEIVYRRIARTITDTKYCLFEGTHFTPVLDNLEKAFIYIYRNI